MCNSGLAFVWAGAGCKVYVEGAGCMQCPLRAGLHGLAKGLGSCVAEGRSCMVEERAGAYMYMCSVFRRTLCLLTLGHADCASSA